MDGRPKTINGMEAHISLETANNIAHPVTIDTR